MSDGVAEDRARLAAELQWVVELHWALSEIDPGRWRADAADHVRARFAALQARLTELTASGPESGALGARLDELKARLAAELAALENKAGSARARWMAFRRALAPSYEALQRTLLELEIHVPSLRPTNGKRAIFHLSSALLALTILYVVPEAWWTIPIAVPLALGAWTLEALRRTRPAMNARIMRFFAPIAHAHEHYRINSGTWFFTSVAILSLTVSPLPCAVGLAVLGVGDPIAAMVGRRFGRVRVMHGRTLEGSLAFVLAATVAGTLAAFAFAPALPIGAALVLGVSAGLAGAVAEMVSLRIDDNLTVALAGSAGAALACTALGVSLG